MRAGVIDEANRCRIYRRIVQFRGRSIFLGAASAESDVWIVERGRQGPTDVRIRPSRGSGTCVRQVFVSGITAARRGEPL